jgi:hypothetical protein
MVVTRKQPLVSSNSARRLLASETITARSEAGRRTVAAVSARRLHSCYKRDNPLASRGMELPFHLGGDGGGQESGLAS